MKSGLPNARVNGKILGQPRLRKLTRKEGANLRKQYAKLVVRRALCPARASRDILIQGQAALFYGLTFAHRARWAAAILRRADADMVRLAGFAVTEFFPLTLAHRAL